MPTALSKIQKSLPKNEQAAIYDFVSQLKKLLCDNLLLAVLYGSKARGDWHKESDIDVLVVVEKKTDRLEQKIIKLAVSLTAKFEKMISVITYSFDEYLDATHPPTALLYFIHKEGFTLYEKSSLSTKLGRSY